MCPVVVPVDTRGGLFCNILRNLFIFLLKVNLNLLRDLLRFLSNVTRHEADNRMNAENLGTLFSTHILCPRKLSPEILQSNHQLLSKAVTFMIEHAEKLFELPEKLCIDVQNYVNQKDKLATPKNKKGFNFSALYFLLMRSPREKDRDSRARQPSGLHHLHLRRQGGQSEGPAGQPDRPGAGPALRPCSK